MIESSLMEMDHDTGLTHIALKLPEQSRHEPHAV